MEIPVELYWLPVRDRITIKLRVHVYKALNGIFPGCITDLLCLRTRDARLRQPHDSLQLATQPTPRAASASSFAHRVPKYVTRTCANVRELCASGDLESGRYYRSRRILIYFSLIFGTATLECAAFLYLRASGSLAQFQKIFLDAVTADEHLICSISFP